MHSDRLASHHQSGSSARLCLSTRARKRRNPRSLEAAPEPSLARGRAVVDAVDVAVAVEGVVVLLAHAEGVDEEGVDVLLRPGVQPGAGFEAGEGLGDWGGQALGGREGGVARRGGGGGVGAGGLLLLAAGLLVDLPVGLLAVAGAV